MYEVGSPTLGAHDTSRTQSVWPESTASSRHPPVSGAATHTLIRLSHPPETKRRTSTAPCAGKVAARREEGTVDGAQETALQPMEWACITWESQVPSSW